MKTPLIILTLMTAVHMAAVSQPQIIAHRGSWKNTIVPQNSLASLNSAIEQKVWGTEFDVHLTKDDVLVVNHDNDFYGLDIATSTYEQLLAKKHPNGENIPTAEEYLKEGMKQEQTKLVYELKTNKLGAERTLRAAELSVALVNRLKIGSQLEYIAFSYDACLKIKELDQDRYVHYLNGDKSPQELKAVHLNGLDYHLSVYKRHPEWIEQAKSLGLKTNVWTVNREDDMRYFIEHRIDFVTTDEPELLKRIILEK